MSNLGSGGARRAAEALVALASGQSLGFALDPARAAVEAEMMADPWAFMTAVDPLTGRPMLWTRDERHPDGYRPFPGHLDYVRNMVDVLHKERMVYIEKARQMIVSTTICLFTMWNCIASPARSWIISRSIEKDSIALIRDKIRAPYSRFPSWFKERHPISPSPQGLVRVYGQESYIQAANEAVAKRSARGGTNTGMLLDEAAFQDQARDIVAAIGPATEKLFIVSTPSLGLGGRWMYKKVVEAENGYVLSEYMRNYT